MKILISIVANAVALFATSLVMAAFPAWGLTIFGPVSALCFAIPGWRLNRQVRRQ